MLNILKYDLYRITKAKATKITLLLMTLFAIMRVYGLQSNINQAKEYRNDPKIY
ncbi:MAG: hypothetical protein LBS28_02975 [Streptococcaceae bacterium]|jgi:hypothetical protein|nr:hypothetical protein [Streptococcaceae bacterium]